MLASGQDVTKQLVVSRTLTQSSLLNVKVCQSLKAYLTKLNRIFKSSRIDPARSITGRLSWSDNCVWAVSTLESIAWKEEGVGECEGGDLLD